MALYFIKDTTLTGIADAIRSKTGSAGAIPVVEMASRIAAITGGGTVEGAHTLTFVLEDGTTYSKPVMHGDTCGDPVALGLFETPTKESTAQYEYTYNGWSLTAGGNADSNALVNVTEDRTVYAAFASEVRYYTINFYDGETLLRTMVCEYGTIPSYTPSSAGLIFEGWEPALSLVTCDMDYFAKWITDASTIVFPERVISMQYNDPRIGDHVYSYISKETLELVTGEQYKITWDGTEYVATGRTIFLKTSNTNTTSEGSLGNGRVASFYKGYSISMLKENGGSGADITDTGEPFFIQKNRFIDGSNGHILIQTKDNSASHVLKIQKIS